MKLLGTLLVLWISSSAMANEKTSNLAIGERVYVDTGNLWEPLQILPRSSGAHGVLDPNLNEKPAQAPLSQPTKPKAEATVAQPSSLVFEKVDIRGRLGQPRVQFGRTRIKVGRVDERIETSRFNRIFQVRRGDL